jgi:hypothetical protein
MHSYFIAAHVGAWLPSDSDGSGVSAKASAVNSQVVLLEKYSGGNRLVLAIRSWVGAILKNDAVTPQVRTIL